MGFFQDGLYLLYQTAEALQVYNQFIFGLKFSGHHKGSVILCYKPM